MMILSLESSAKSASVALTKDGRVIASAFQCTALTHSRTLMPMVDAMLKNAEIAIEEIDAFAVAAGPGSFTGLRIGIAALKGLAWATDKPCFGVSTLEAMAYNMIQNDALLICAMDARRGQIYNALFEAKDGKLTRLCDDRAIALSLLAEELKENPMPKIVLGDGGELCQSFLADAGIVCTLAKDPLLYQNAIGVSLAAEDANARGEAKTAQELLPFYLRPAQAQTLAERKEKEK